MQRFTTLFDRVRREVARLPLDPLHCRFPVMRRVAVNDQAVRRGVVALRAGRRESEFGLLVLAGHVVDVRQQGTVEALVVFAVCLDAVGWREVAHAQVFESADVE